MKELPIFNKESNSRRRQERLERRNNSSQKNAYSHNTTGRTSVSRYRFSYSQESDEQSHRKVIISIFFIMILVYLYTLFRTETLLESYRLKEGEEQRLGIVLDDEETNADNTTSDANKQTDEDIRGLSVSYDLDRFIIFKHMGFGQGTGNIMAGLLAAHLLGEEFNRIVCVEKHYVDFHDAFELKDPHTRAACARLVDNEPNVPDEDFLQAISLAYAPNECFLQERLSSDTKVIKFEGNTYPRWPNVPHGFFLKFYQPNRALLDIVPYIKQPESVVHLRAPDGVWDKRKGLDRASFMELGGRLPRDTYLVTNLVDWYKFFEKKFNWSHPHWNIVRHSVNGVPWQSMKYKSESSIDQQHQGPIQMWADWYTILMAKQVYHTHSEFSNSAVHWMNIEDAHVLIGMNRTTRQLALRPETWIADGPTPALVDRRSNPNLPLEQRLKACDIPHTLIKEYDPKAVSIIAAPRPVPVTGIRVGGKAEKMPPDGEPMIAWQDDVVT